MLQFKQAARVSAREALKSPYFSNAADRGETANDSSLSSLSSSLSDTDHDSDGIDREEALTSPGAEI